MKTQINERTQWQTQKKSNVQIRIVARTKRILDDDVVITHDNIQRIGEIIAVAVIKTVMCRSGKNLYWLYDVLIQDCKRENDVNNIYIWTDTAGDATIESIHLTPAESETLLVYMLGMSHIKIAKLSNMNRATTWKFYAVIL